MVQSEKLPVLGPCAGALFSEGIRPEKGPPKLGRTSIRECVAGTGGEKPTGCVLWRAHCGGVQGSREPGGGKDVNGTPKCRREPPMVLGALLKTLGFQYQKPIGSRF